MLQRKLIVNSRNLILPLYQVIDIWDDVTANGCRILWLSVSSARDVVYVFITCHCKKCADAMHISTENSQLLQWRHGIIIIVLSTAVCSVHKQVGHAHVFFPVLSFNLLILEAFGQRTFGPPFPFQQPVTCNCNAVRSHDLVQGEGLSCCMGRWPGTSGLGNQKSNCFSD